MKIYLYLKFITSNYFPEYIMVISPAWLHSESCSGSFAEHVGDKCPPVCSWKEQRNDKGRQGRNTERNGLRPE